LIAGAIGKIFPTIFEDEGVGTTARIDRIPVSFYIQGSFLARQTARSPLGAERPAINSSSCRNLKYQSAK
jgi:hypothetical protein